jgi:hypothetical protein
MSRRVLAQILEMLPGFAWCVIGAALILLAM